MNSKKKRGKKYKYTWLGNKNKKKIANDDDGEEKRRIFFLLERKTKGR